MTEKTCTECKKKKQTVDFHRNHKMKDGRLSVCKDCRNHALKAYRATDERRAIQLKHSLKWKANNPIKRNAHSKVNKNLTRPNNCEKCSYSGDVHAHHTDYSRPLDVIWLCPKCHSNEHRRELEKET